MKPYRTLRLLLTFYRSTIAFSLAVTLACSSILWINGLRSFVFIFWFKIITLAITAYFINSYKKKELFYFRNLGISRSSLWSFTLILDMLFYIAVLTLTYQLR
jgi:hypothetical protein